LSAALPISPKAANRRAENPRVAGARGPAGRRFQAIVVAVASLAAFGGCQSRGHTTVPDELVGVWKTSAPKYKDRYLQFTKATIVFGTGFGSPDVQRITKVDVVREEQGILYTVSYKDDPDGHQSTFAFYYEPRKNAVIRFKHQQQIAWTQEGR